MPPVCLRLGVIPQLKVSASRGAVEEPHCIDEKFLSLIGGIGSAPFRVTLFFLIFFSEFEKQAGFYAGFLGSPNGTISCNYWHIYA